MRHNSEPFPIFPAANWIDPIYECYWRLPDLLEPPPVVDNPDPHCLMLIHLFTDGYTRNKNIHAWIRSAIYSRWSVLRNTDAVAEGIEVKFYIEDKLKHTLWDTLKKNFIDPDRDVIWFAAPPLPKSETGEWAYLTKKLSSYWDERFVDYDWVLCTDADLFYLPLPNEMFSKIKALHLTDIGMLFAFIEEHKLMKDHIELRIKHGLEKIGMTLPELFAFAGVDIDPFRNTLIKPAGCFWVYPANHFHTHHQDFVQWMQAYAPYFGDDEMAMVYASEKFDLELLPIRSKLGLAMNSISYYLQFDENEKPDGQILHGIILPEDEPAFYKLLNLD